MHVWNNDKLRRLYDLQKISAKNHQPAPFTDEELAILTLKNKAFQQVNDPKTKRLIELAYTLGSLNGLLTADSELEAQKTPAAIKPTAQVIAPGHERPQVLEERLYVLACKVKNRQDKLVYTTTTLKARTDAEAEASAVTEFRVKNQAVVTCKVIRSFGTDTMQYQFGIGKKEMDALFAQGKKLV